MSGKKVKVPYTEPYVATPSDTLSRIAAKFDTTVSELKKINRLMSDAIYPGQIIFVPDENYATMSRSQTISSLSSVSSSTDQSTKPPSHLPSSTSSYSIPTNRRRNYSEEAAAFSLSPPTHRVPGRVEREVADQWVAPPRPLTDEEVKRLDDECHERFIKLYATYLSSVRMDEVPGVLLVTPDAVMFDPDTDDPLVQLNGVSDYCMVIPMNCVASASIYHDAEDMRRRRKETSVLRVSMTHEDGCPQAYLQQQQQQQQKQQQLKLLEQDKQSQIKLDGQDTSLSDVSLSRGSDAASPLDSVAIDSKPASATPCADVANSRDILSNVPSNKSDAKVVATRGDKTHSSCDVDANVDLLSAAVPASHDPITAGTDAALKSVDRWDGGGEGTGGVTGGVSLEKDKSESVLLENKNNDGIVDESSMRTDESSMKRDESSMKMDASSMRIDESSMERDESSSMKIDESSMKTDESSMKRDESSMKTDESSMKRGIDIDSQEVHNSKVIDDKSLALLEQKEFSANNGKPDVINTDKNTQEECNKAAAETRTLPVYLCLGVRVKVDANKSSQLETCTKSPIRPEYWYSIPYDKVDHLYAFFVQWTPSALDEEEDATEADHGFVVLENGSGEIGKSSDHSPGGDTQESEKLHRKMSKDWEIVNMSELRRRISKAELENLPLPDLSEPSSIITDLHLRQLMQHLPARAEGCAWKLVYSSSRHGFSLKTLYRCMNAIDSPTVIIIKDNHDKIFGALLSCAVKQSDHFYGNGESYLFTFYPEFKKYPWTGINSFFIKGNSESLCVGASEGANGLWLDGDLNHGRTQTCLTFENELLTVSEDFIINFVEGWCFM